MNRAMNILVLTLLGFTSQSSQAQVRVSGTVSDLSGSPVPGSLVAAIPVRTGSAGSIAWTGTDGRGAFSLTLSEGRYEIRAKNEPEGYPDPNLLFAADPTAIFPQVEVSASDVSSVQVKFGSKGGILEGDLQDKETSDSIPEGRVSLCDARRPDICAEISTDQSGHFRLTIPSKAVLISASAKNYRSVAYGKELTLPAGGHRHIELELEHE